MLDFFLDILGTTGKKFINFVANIGHFFIFFGNAIYWVFKPPWYFIKIYQQNFYPLSISQSSISLCLIHFSKYDFNHAIFFRTAAAWRRSLYQLHLLLQQTFYKVMWLKLPLVCRRLLLLLLIAKGLNL